MQCVSSDIQADLDRNAKKIEHFMPITLENYTCIGVRHNLIKNENFYSDIKMSLHLSPCLEPLHTKIAAV